MIHARGLSRHHLEQLTEEEFKAKHAERRAAVKEILEEIIKYDCDEVGLPPGTKADELRLLFDREGDGRVSHEDFTLGLGRILLASPFQQSMMSLINQGHTRRIGEVNKESHDT